MLCDSAPISGMLTDAAHEIAAGSDNPIIAEYFELKAILDVVRPHRARAARAAAPLAAVEDVEDADVGCVCCYNVIANFCTT